MYALSLHDYIMTGDTSVKKAEFFNIQLPDVESYHTCKGISYKVKSGYRWDNQWRFPVSVEFIGKGGDQTDVKVGVIKVFPEYNSLEVRLDTFISKNFAFNMVALYPIHKNFEVSVGLDYDHVDTFEGARNIGSVKKGKTYSQVWGRVSYKF